MGFQDSRCTLRVFLFGPAVLFSNERQPSSQFGAEVGIGSGNLNRLSRRFSPEPAIQFLAGGLDVATLLSDWQTFCGPSLGDGHWLSKKCCDSLPASQEFGLCLRSGLLRHASTMLCRAVGLQQPVRYTVREMDVERIIDEIQQLEEMFEAPDIRPLSPSDVSAANRRHDEMLAQSPWFRLWHDFGVCCRPGPPEFRTGKIET